MLELENLELFWYLDFCEICERKNDESSSTAALSKGENETKNKIVNEKSSDFVENKASSDSDIWFRGLHHCEFNNLHKSWQSFVEINHGIN